MNKSDKFLERLEKSADDVLARRKRRRNPEPIVVEFAGSPKAGKTTNIDIIAHFFKRIGFKVWAPTEGASKRTPYHLRRDLVAFNAWSLPVECARQLYRQRTFCDDRIDLSNFFDTVEKKGDYVRRDIAESSSRVVQVVSCAVITCNEKILCIRRTKKTNRSELSLRWTVMIGGHVDNLDRHARNPIAICAEREVKEELGFHANTSPELLGLAIDPATPVGRHHIGVVYNLESNFDNIKVESSCDNIEFVHSRKTQVHYFKNRQSIRKLMKKNQFDPWSHLFLNSTVADNILNINTGNNIQRELALTWNV